ncbi:Anti-repressor SinI [Thalassobacillus cyri]|uniref:Anti-repressor SinI n=1 Tax=Thalassobacillus cyri TaxID=571932 RepID=A0A1H4D5T9_9BACI|nr:anti-repressor SinI family protein [Thalassobacillus cyri]SEA67906.1 Anti-repressor SinI [Thalassobacillus cyri]
MTISKQQKTEGLDTEWVELMKEARELGMSKDDIRAFFSLIKREKQK